MSIAQLTQEARAPLHIENTTDATRGELIVPRVQTRRAELEVALHKLSANDLRARNDIQLALSSVDALLTGDLEKLSDVTAFELNRWLEHTKHLAEVPPSAATRGSIPSVPPATSAR